MANKLTQEQFIEKATLLHNGFYNYNKVHYVNARTNIDIICPLHGLFHQQPQVHLRGGGCPECKKLKVSQNRLSNTQTFIKKDYSNKENLKGLTKKPDNIIIGLDLLQIILKGQVSADV